MPTTARRRLLFGKRYRVLDRFSQPNGTNLNGKALDIGTVWTVRNGTFDINGGRARSTSPTVGAPGWVATTELFSSDYSLVATINLPGTSDGGLVVRYDPATGKHYFAQIQQSGGNAFQIYEWDGTSFTSRASANPAVVSGTDYEIAIVCSGPVITATLNGGNAISYGSATVNQSGTQGGFRVAGAMAADAAKLDDFRRTA